MRSTVGITGYAPTYNTVLFRVRSVSRPNLVHRAYVQFTDMQKLKEQISNIGESQFFEDPVEARKAILAVLQSDVKAHCTCESFKYYRSYQMTQLDASIFPENRPPRRNDPTLSRTHMCHHLFAVMKYLFTYEQHLVKFLMMNDPVISQTLKIDMAKATEIQLNDVIDSWVDKVEDATDSERLSQRLKAGISKILKGAGKFINKFRTENTEIIDRNSKLVYLTEEISEESVVQSTENFVDYVANNFIPREIRENVSDTLENFIMQTFKEYMASEQEHPEPELPDELKVPEDEFDQNKIEIEDPENKGDEEMIQKESVTDKLNIHEIIRDIIKNRHKLFEEGTPLGPIERPQDSPQKAANDAKLAAKYDDIPADDLNGDNPIEMKPEEVAVQNAIEEYLTQTGKTAFATEFQDIILGILRDFDSPKKIQQLGRFIKTVVNTTSNLREPQEYDETPEVPPMGDEMPPEGGGGEPTPDEMNADINAEPNQDQEMDAVQQKKDKIRREM